MTSKADGQALLRWTVVSVGTEQLLKAEMPCRAAAATVGKRENVIAPFLGCLTNRIVRVREEDCCASQPGQFGATLCTLSCFSENALPYSVPGSDSVVPQGMWWYCFSSPHPLLAGVRQRATVITHASSEWILMASAHKDLRSTCTACGCACTAL